MDSKTNKSKIFQTHIVARHRGISAFNRKTISEIQYKKGDDLYMGVILQTNNGFKEYFSIATGKIIEKDGKQYYEVYPNLYTYKQMEIIDDALRTIRWADAPQGTPYE